MNELGDNDFSPKKINIAQLNFSIFEMVRKVERGDIKLEAEFQRNPRWQLEKKSKLIESIILDIPIQAIYLSEQDGNRYEIIDGQQRIRTITEFMNNEFKLDNTSFFKNKNKSYFSDLESHIQRKIEDFQLLIFLVKKDNEPDVKFEIFERINTGAVKLNSQELRNCIYREKGIPFIKALVNEETYRRVIKDKSVNSNAMQDQELVLRFMAFYYRGIDAYTGNLKKFLNQTLDDYELYRNRENEFKLIFINTMETIYMIFGEEAFLIKPKNTRKDEHKTKAKHKINLALFDILTYTFAKYEDIDILQNRDQIKNELQNLILSNRDFEDALTGASTTTKNKTYDRFEIWENSVKNILGVK